MDYVCAGEERYEYYMAFWLWVLLIVNINILQYIRLSTLYYIKQGIVTSSQLGSRKCSLPLSNQRKSPSTLMFLGAYYKSIYSVSVILHASEGRVRKESTTPWAVVYTPYK